MFVKLKEIGTGMVMKMICGSESVGETLTNSAEEVRSVTDMVGQDLMKTFMVGGVSLYGQTIDVWTGTEKRTAEVEVKFVAEGDPEFEVFLPIKTLCYWASPRGHSQKESKNARWESLKQKIAAKARFFMQPPAKLELIIGEEGEACAPLIHFKECIITSCTPKFQPPYTENGFPLYGECQLTFHDMLVQDGDDNYPDHFTGGYHDKYDIYKKNIGGMGGKNPQWVSGRGLTGEILDLIRRKSGKYGQIAPILKDILNKGGKTSKTYYR